MPIEAPLTSTFRNIKRVTEIVSVLIRFGFGDFVHATGLDRWYARGRRLFRRSTPDPQVERLPFAARVRRVLEELGPTFIKMGQILSTRPDLLPPDFIEEFRGLQDNCFELPFATMQTTLSVALHGKEKELFASFDETPLASGSIGQTYRAKLDDGTPVVVKVMRPGVRNTIRSDMEVLDFLARWLETHYKNLGFSPVGVVREFSHQLNQELDYHQEAESTERLRTLFLDSKTIDFPRVFWNATTNDVLTTEEIVGQPLSKLDPKSLSSSQRVRIVKNLCNAVFQQCFRYGFFHADPHPGNIFVQENERVVFIDCGMTGYIDPKTSDLLASIFYGVAVGDTETVVRAATDLAEIDPMTSSRRDFQADVATYIARFQATPVSRIQIGKLLQDFFEKLRKYQIHCPSDIVFLIKTITTTEGIVSTMSPNFDVVQYAKPYIIRLVQRRYSPNRIRKRVTRTALAYAEMLETLPNHTDKFFRLLNRNQFQLRLTHEGLAAFDRTVATSSKRISMSLLCTSLIIAGAILIHAETARPCGNILIIGGCCMIALSLFIMATSFLFDRKK
ncbi:MAG: AarF/ABC1/UbiB kinase family protein [Planctomycetaceae bacterium]|jgi:ubiquinone biosynthesis protein|nr:AarF/ABC1/UbiB kinase family protein [Planctomycetaceae bacterium]